MSDASDHELRRRTREGWQRSAIGWNAHWPIIEAMGSDLTRSMVEAARMRPGHLVLDVATGIGEPAISAAQRVAPEGRVVAIDASPDMLSHARARATRLGLENLQFLEADMEHLPLPAGSVADLPTAPQFDVLLSRFGLMFALSVPRALEGFRTSLRRSGRLILAVWGPVPSVPLIELPTRCLREVFTVEPPQGDVPGPFRFSDPENLAVLLRQLEGSGFSSVTTEHHTVRLDLESAEHFAEFSLATSSRSRAMLDEQPARRTDYTRTLVRAAEEHRRPDGSVRLDNQAILITALRD